ncbi:hypothetical protein EDC26_11620 [Paralcaligenes ureilyticus]|uniref:Uncharacterized protein n=1 Tax=Paralcaligenes ureilyticus TaxID=627131 RepID=A0A4R3LRB2_9BURK|nr:hypothetical protein EDC26_11620 [Paralcaligenes ureilyticus]
MGEALPGLTGIRLHSLLTSWLCKAIGQVFQQVFRHTVGSSLAAVRRPAHHNACFHFFD